MKTMKMMMKTVIAMMLAAAFLVSRPALAGDEKPKTEKSDKADKGKKKDDKSASAPAPAPAPAPSKDDKKGGW